MEAEARGMLEILAKQAEGFSKLVAAAGGDSNAAVQYLIADKIEKLLKIQVDAISGLKIDKVTVWDNMGGGEGGSTTANFLAGMMKAIPPLNETFKMAGMQLPAFLGKEAEEKAEA
jgi:flotillin